MWILELLHHIAEAIPAIKGPQALVEGHANSPGLLCCVVEGRQKGSHAASSLAQHHGVAPTMTSEENTLATVHMFITVVAPVLVSLQNGQWNSLAFGVKMLAPKVGRKVLAVSQTG